MKRNAPNLEDYAAALAVSRGGTFRAAATALGTSPSALSRQIAALEQRLGSRLFDRDTRTVTLTSSGEAFVRIAERMVHAADDAMVEFDAHVSASRGRLTIAGLPSVTAGFLPQYVKRFARTNPEIDVKILDALSDGVLNAVESGAADFGFTAGTHSARSRLAFQPMLDDDFIAIGTADGPLRDDRVYDWDELTLMPFIAMARGTSVRELIDGACQRLGRPLEPRYEVAHLVTAGAFVAEGLGITALPTLTLPVLRLERLVQREIRDFGARRRIGLVRRSGRTQSPAARAFLAQLNLDRRSGAMGAAAIPS